MVVHNDVQLQLPTARDMLSTAARSLLKHRAVDLLVPSCQSHAFVLGTELCQEHGPVRRARGRSVSGYHGPKDHQEGGEPAQAGANPPMASSSAFIQSIASGIVQT